MTCAGTVENGIDDYSALHTQNSSTRNASYKQLVNAYYDLATVFYEWGWGESFHFCTPYPHEKCFAESIRRHEYVLAAQLTDCYGPSKHVVDVGCGIGGPARNIAKFLQCRITGVTLNPYQVLRGNVLNQADVHARHLVKSVQGDFMELDQKFTADSLDGAYAIEATCHAPDRVQCYRQIYNVLKPGATFCCYEWCLTDAFDANNQEHRRLKKDMEQGNGLPDICHTSVCLQALREAGFEVVSESDLALQTNIEPWMTPLQPSWNPCSQRFQFNPFGAVLTNFVIGLLETVRLAPAGTVKTQQVLQAGGFALRDAGQSGIFTTMYLLVGRKPI